MELEVLVSLFSDGPGGGFLVLRRGNWLRYVVWNLVTRTWSSLSFGLCRVFPSYTLQRGNYYSRIPENGQANTALLSGPWASGTEVSCITAIIKMIGFDK